MITNSSIGKYGRLGNQMFQYAMLLGVAGATGQEIVLPAENEIEITEGMWNPSIHEIDTYALDLYKLFKISARKVARETLASFSKAEEPHGYAATFIPQVFDVKGSVDFKGYFQTWKYFEHCKETVLKEFSFNEVYETKSNEFLNKFKNRKVFGVHVRRGDCVPHAGRFQVLLSSQYYVDQIRRMRNSHKCLSCVFVFFSDDLDYCANEIMPEICEEDVEFAFADGSDHLLDFATLSKLDGIVMANSSFSWWAAYLQKEANCKIAPNKWWGFENSFLNEHDIRCHQWERGNVEN